MSHDHERLIHRAKIGHDNVTPSGNGVAAFALARFGHLIGAPRFVEAGERTVRAFKPLLENQASAHTSLCLALAEQLVPPTMVILRGSGDTKPWQRELNARYLPQAMTMAVPENVPGLPAALDKPVAAKINAWVCRGVTCLPPIDDLGEMVAAVTTATE